MLKSKLIRLVSTLTKSEIQELGDFLASPFFNTNPSVLKLYEAISVSYPDFKEEQISKQYLYTLVYPNKNYRDNSFRNLILDLTNLIQEYIKQVELKKNKALQEQLLLNAFSSRTLKREFDHQFDKLIKRSQDISPKDSMYYLEQYLFLKTYYHFPETNRQELPREFLINMLSNLNQFFALSKLQLAIEVASRQRVLKEKPPTFYFKPYIEQYLASLSKNKQILLRILLLLEKFYSNPSEDLIQLATKLFKMHHKKFSLFDKKMILMIIINQMNSLLLSGHPAYLKKIHHLYQFGLMKNILLYNNRLVSFDFLNIVTTASRNNKTSWATDFIKNYKNYLPENEKEQVEALAYATVHYDLGNYGEVIELLLPYSFRKSAFGLRFRFISVKAYIELVFEDSKNLKFTKNFIHRMEQYVNRRAKTDQLSGFSNFLKITKLIIDNCVKKNSYSIDRIRERIKNTSPLIAKNWLLQKVSDLEQL